jgi:cytochrome c biogenesis factor
MYIATVAALLVVFPLVSSALQLVFHHDSAVLPVLLRWFVFWGVGIRLLLAGVRQIAQPR